jgi:hypothetical protein
MTMPTRSEILETLAASQEQVTTYYQGLSSEERERPCTASGVPGATAWRAKDHLAHLAENERNIQSLLRLMLAGQTSLPDNLGTMNQEEQTALINQRNQSYVNAHHDDSLETMFADLAAAREATLKLLEQFSDEQLGAPASISGMSEWTAGWTAGDLFFANTQHVAMHLKWIEEGLRLGL